MKAFFILMITVSFLFSQNIENSNRDFSFSLTKEFLQKITFIKHPFEKNA